MLWPELALMRAFSTSTTALSLFPSSWASSIATPGCTGSRHSVLVAETFCFCSATHFWLICASVKQLRAKNWLSSYFLFAHASIFGRMWLAWLFVSKLRNSSRSSSERPLAGAASEPSPFRLVVWSSVMRVHSRCCCLESWWTSWPRVPWSGDAPPASSLRSQNFELSGSLSSGMQAAALPASPDSPSAGKIATVGCKLVLNHRTCSALQSTSTKLEFGTSRSFSCALQSFRLVHRCQASTLSWLLVKCSLRFLQAPTIQRLMDWTV